MQVEEQVEEFANLGQVIQETKPEHYSDELLELATKDSWEARI